MTNDRITGPIITIHVGTKKPEDFHVHESTLKESSKFFQAALNKHWKEGQERKINLPEDDPQHFAAYVEWLYRSTIVPKSTASAAEITKEEVAREHPYLARLYVLGEKLQDDGFCDSVMTAMIKYFAQRHTKQNVRYYFNISVVRIIYDGTMEDSPARKFLVEAYKARGRKEWLRDRAKCLECPEFLLDLAKGQLPGSCPATAPDALQKRQSDGSSSSGSRRDALVPTAFTEDVWTSRVERRYQSDSSFCKEAKTQQHMAYPW